MEGFIENFTGQVPNLGFISLWKTYEFFFTKSENWVKRK